MRRSASHASAQRRRASICSIGARRNESDLFRVATPGRLPELAIFCGERAPARSTRRRLSRVRRITGRQEGVRFKQRTGRDQGDPDGPAALMDPRRS